MTQLKLRDGELLMVPSIHLNGTSRGSLLADLRNAAHALREAVSALAAAAPNARDYYVQTPGAYEKARKQHEKRMHRLADNIHELNEIGRSIQED